jgi:hypothetical protein
MRHSPVSSPHKHERPSRTKDYQRNITPSQPPARTGALLPPPPHARKRRRRKATGWDSGDNAARKRQERRRRELAVAAVALGDPETHQQDRKKAGGARTAKAKGDHSARPSGPPPLTRGAARETTALWPSGVDAANRTVPAVRRAWLARYAGACAASQVHPTRQSPPGIAGGAGGAAGPAQPTLQPQTSMVGGAAGPVQKPRDDIQWARTEPSSTATQLTGATECRKSPTGTPPPSAAPNSKRTDTATPTATPRESDIGAEYQPESKCPTLTSEVPLESPNALITTRAVACGEELFREDLQLLPTKESADEYEHRLHSQWQEPLLDLPGEFAAALINLDQPTDPRSILYMMNQARGKLATVVSPFKFTVSKRVVTLVACAARDLAEGTELTWDYNQSRAHRFPWEPVPVQAPAAMSRGPQPKRRARAATGWADDDARKRRRTKEAALRRLEASSHEAPPATTADDGIRVASRHESPQGSCHTVHSPILI